ncbi:MAG: YesL family protein [Lachnospiraceae bacterium]|nr:YesL family protein [Lachnospiraceae bacterium]
MKLFNADGPLMQGLNKVADLMLLNIFALIFCLPIITIGASITALYYMALKIVRGEEVYIFKGFLKSFKMNFRQATIIWLAQVVVMVVLVFDYFILYGNPENNPSVLMQVLFLATTVVALAVFLFIYPVLSKFDNTIVNTFKNAFVMAIMQFPKVIVMAVLWVIPPLLGIFVFQLFPLVVLFGLSVPAYVSAMLYNKFFKRMEDKMIEHAKANGLMPEDPGSEDEHIFSDEVLTEKSEKKES